MKHFKKIIAAFIISVLFIFSLSANFHAWDYGGDSDWGGGDSDWSGGDSDWGDSGSDFIFVNSSGGDISIGGIVIVIAVVVVVILVKSKTGNNRASVHQSSPMQMSDTSSVNLHNLSLLKEKDPNFSEAAMLSKVEHLFISSQIAYADQDYEPMRPFFSNALFEQHVKQIHDKKARGERNVVSEMAVLSSKLENFSEDGHNEYLDVWLRVKYKSYIGRIDNPEIVVSGSKTRTFYLDFRWQFTRSAGRTTDAATDAVKTGNCPNCGAPINLNQSGKCEYCGSVISTTEYDWVLSKIDALQQRSTS